MAKAFKDWVSYLSKQMTSNTRYNNGKIYKIINNFNDMVYIGST